MLRKTLVRMLPRRVKDRVKHSITKLVPPTRNDSFELSLSRLAPDLKSAQDVFWTPGHQQEKASDDQGPARNGGHREQPATHLSGPIQSRPKVAGEATPTKVGSRWLCHF